MNLKLIRRQWPAHIVSDVAISLEHIANAISSHYDTGASQHALKLAHNKYWLLCDCNPHNPAALTVRKMANGQYCLVNIKNKGEHKGSCALAYTPAQNKQSSSEDESNNFRFSSFKEKLNSPGAKSSGESVHRKPALQRLRTFLLKQAGFDGINTERTFKGNITALKDASADDIFVNGIPLSSRLFFGFNQFYLAKQLLESEAAQSEQSPVFIVDVIDEVTKVGSDYKTAKYFSSSKQSEFTLFGHITDVKADTKIEGPYLAFALVQRIKDGNGKPLIAPTRCIITPIASKKQWIMVKAHQERVAIEKLESSMAWYQKTLNIGISVTKPLEAITTSLGVCQPSFVIRMKNTSAILDLQVKDDTNYQTQRSLEYIIASDIGGGGYCVVTDKMDKKEISDALFHASKRLFKELKHSDGSKAILEGKIIPLKE